MMEEKNRRCTPTQGTWELFLQTGQVRDYLNYRKEEREQTNPRRRVVNSSKNKAFY